MPVTSILENRLELELWRRKLSDGFVTGDTTSHILLARIGHLIESFVCGKSEISSWFFWLKEDDFSQKTDPFESTQQDIEDDLSAALERR